MSDYNILITNDDGIESPGLKAAVEAVLDIATVTVLAPSGQQTATGRGLTGDMQSRFTPKEYRVKGVKIRAFHCDCSPALIIKHGLRTIFKDPKPDLLISGINYGENLGINITSSGTVGAALEAASVGVPGIAISKQTDIGSHHIYTDQDWSATAYFLNKLSRLILEKKFQQDVDVLKIDVPDDATPLTEWKITKLARSAYYFKDIENPDELSRLSDGKTTIKVDKETLDPDSDIYALAIDNIVSITPLSIDLTSRVNLSDLQNYLKS